MPTLPVNSSMVCKKSCDRPEESTGGNSRICLWIDIVNIFPVGFTHAGLFVVMPTFLWD